MNKHLYRVIFNKARGLLMVVAENVSSDGKAGGCVAGSPAGLGSGAVSVTLDPLRFAFLLVLGLILPGAATAAIVADASAPAGQQPTVITTANGVLQVDIQTPSAAGVSRNTYSQFDVDNRGAILNNSRVDVQSQLGGWITGNQRLNDGTARIILNEVNSSAASHLNGYIEVAGDRAQVVIANPAGISCAGCGFINADRATLTTGAPILNEGRLDGYAVSRGEVSIQGAGLDGRSTAYTDIIARSVRINAGIWANDLKVTTGSNQVSADHSQVVPFASLGAKPEYAIDVAHLGGMYAGKIRLVGTEHGVGVRNAGTLAAESGDLVVTLDGRLENTGLLQGKQNIQLTTTGGVRNSGTLSAQRELLLSTTADLDNSAGRINAARLDIGAQSLKNRDGDLEQTGTQVLAIVAESLTNREAGRIGVAETPSSGTGSESGSGSMPTVPETGATPPSSGENNGGSAPEPEHIERLADGQLLIGELLDNDAGRILAGGKVTLATENLNNDQGRLGVHQLSVNGGEFSNRAGELTVTTDADITTTRLRNDQGKFSVGGALDLRAGELSNRGGELVHSDSSATEMSVTGRLDNSAGLLATNAASLTLDAGVLVNEDGRLEHAGEQGLTLRLGDLHGAGGRITTGGALDLDAGDIDHRGATLTATQVNLRADNLDNRAGSLISSGTENNRLDVAGRLDNSQGGSIASNGDLSLSAAHLSNARGSIQHAGDGQLAIQAGTLDGVAGTLVSNGTLTLGGGQLDLGEGSTSAQRIQVEANSLRTAGGRLIATGTEALELRIKGLLDNAGGTIAGNGALELSAGELDNRAGTLQSSSEQASQIRVAGRLDNSAGILATTGELSLTAGELHNAGGQVQTAGDSALRLTVDGLLDNSADGRIATAGELAIQAQTLDNRTGRIEHAGEAGLSIAVETLSGAGGTLASNSGLTLSGEHIDLREGETSAERIQVKADALITAGGRLVATGEEALELRVSGLLDNAGGTIAGNGALELSANELDNGAGILQSSSEQASQIHVTGSLDNSAGTLATTGALSLAAGELHNVGGRVQTADDSALRLAIDGLLDNSADGHIATAGKLAIQAQTLDNRAGRIEHAGEAGLSIAVETLKGAGGTLASNSDLTLSGEHIDLSKGSTSAQRIQVDAGDLLNASGRLISSGLDALQLRIRHLLDNSAGLLVGNGDMTLVADRLVNEGGAIEHAGAGLLAIDVNRLEGAGGSLIGNGALEITGEHIDLRNGSTSAQRIQVSAGELITAGGRLIATGIETLQLQVRERLDNAGGTVATNGTLDLAAGELDNRGGTLQAAGEQASRIQVAGSFDNSAGTLATGGDLSLRAAELLNAGGLLRSVDGGTELTIDGLLDNSAGLIAGSGDMTLGAQRLVNQGGAIEHAGEGLLAIDANRLEGAGGSLAGNGALHISGEHIDLRNGQTSAGHIQVRAGELITAGGRLIASGVEALQLQVRDLLDNAGGTLATNGALELSAGALDNRGGTLQAAGDQASQLRVGGVFDNRSATLATAGDLRLVASELLNASGSAQSVTGGVELAIDGLLDNGAGLIAGSGDMTLTAQRLVNVGGAIEHAGAGLLTIDVNRLGGNDGTLAGNGALQITGEHIDLRGGDTRAQRIKVEAGDLITAGGRLIASGLDALQLRIRNLLDNSAGLLAGNGDMTLVADRLVNEGGAIEHAGAGLLSIDVHRLDGAGGSLVGNGALQISGEHLDLANANTHAQRIQVSAGELINTGGRLIATGIEAMQLHIRALLDNAGGTLASNGALYLTAGTLDNRAGTLQAAGEQASQVQVGGAFDNYAGNLATTGDLSLSVSELLNTGGLVQSVGGSVQVDVKGLLDNSVGGRIAAAGDLSIRTHTLGNRAGSVENAGEGLLSIEANRLDGSGGTLAGNGALSISGEHIDLSEGSTSAQRIQVEAGDLITASGRLIATGRETLQLQVSNLLNNAGGTLASNGALYLTAGTLDNRAGILQATGKQTSQVQVSVAFDNHAGTLATTGDLSLSAGELLNTGGLVQSVGGSVQVDVEGLLDNSVGGRIAAAGDLSIRTHTLGNRAGSVENAGEGLLSIEANRLDGIGGTLASNGALSISGEHIDLSEGSTSALRIEVEAGDLLNAGGRLVASGLDALQLRIRHLLDNSAGLLAGNGDMTLTAQRLVNESGAIEHAGEGLLSIAVQRLDGAGGSLVGNGALEISGEHIDLTNASTHAERIQVQASDLITAGGRLIATGLETLQLQVSNLLNNAGGTLAGNGALDLSAGTLDNRAGTLQVAGEQASRIQVAGTLDNQAGVLATRGDTALQAGELLNTAGALQTEASLALAVEGLLSNDAGGVISVGGAADVRARSLDNRAGTVSAGSELIIATAEGIDNRAGVLVGGDAIRVSTATLDNREAGTVASLRSDLELTSAGRVDNAGGTLQAAGALTVESSGLSNAQGTLLGASLSLDTLQQALDNRGGTLATTEAGMTLRTGVLDNTGGLLQATGDLAVDTHGAALLNSGTGESGGILAGGDLAVVSGDLDNRGGLIHAQDDLAVHAGRFDNRNAGLTGSGGHSLLRVDTLDNSGGTLHAGLGLDAWVKGILTNNGGLISAGELLKLSAAAVLNRDTGAANPATPLGLQGGSVEITTGQLDNRAGLIAADEHIALTGTAANSILNNSQGTVSSAGSLVIKTGAVTNTGGTLLAATDNRITANSLTGDGRVLSQGDLGLTLKSDFNNSGEVTANGQARIETSGQLTNSGSLRAGDLDVHASAITNTATGEISGGRTRLTTPGTLTNRGLIDGQQTWINAGTLNNIGTGRIYGDHIAIAAGNLTNREETVGGVPSSATIAARERLDLGISGTLLNREKSLIFSAGSGSRALNIGGALDANGWAIGRAGNVENRSATIESLGGLSLSATTLLNVNDHLQTAEVRTLGPTAVTYIQPAGDSNKHDVSKFKWEEWSRADRYRWKTDPAPTAQQEAAYKAALEELAYLEMEAGAMLREGDPEYARLMDIIQPYENQFIGPEVRNWTEYKVTRTEYETRVTQSAPALIRSGGDMHLSGGQLINDKSQIIVGGALTGDLDRLDNIDAIGEYRVREEGTVQDTSTTWRGGLKNYHERRWGSLNSYNPADQVNTISLNVVRVETHTNGQGSGYRVDSRDAVTVGASASGALGGQVQQDARTVSGSEAKLQTGQEFSAFDGRQANQTLGSQVDSAVSLDAAAAGALQGGQALGALNGQQASQALARQVDSAVLLDAAAASAPQAGQALGAIGGQKADQVTVSLGKAVAASAAASAAKAQGNGVVGTASGGTAGSVEQTTPDNVGPVGSVWDLPTSSLFKVSPGSGNFLVETDPRFTNQRTWLNSDYLLGQLSLDAAGMQQRIGDGFYEQWLIREQVSQLTGRRFLEGYGDDEAQYRALMEAGVTLAQDWNLRPGVALSAEQLARLTSDIVWLVEETVRLPDGTLTTALVPKVYLVPREGDLDGNGTLISAESIDLRLEGDLVNSGTIAGRSVVQLSGDNLRNLGGRISGEDVLMQARTDLENLGGRIDAQDSLLLSAGRDLTVASTTHSEQNSGENWSASRTNLDRVAGLYVSNPGGTLVLAAGQDITLAGAEVINAGAGSQTLIAAGRDLTLAAVHTESQHTSSARVETPESKGFEGLFRRRPADTHSESQTKDIGTTLRTGGDLTLQAGGDLFAQAAQVRSGGNLHASAGGDLLIVSGSQSASYSLDGKGVTIDAQDSTQRSSGFNVTGDMHLSAGNDLLLMASQLKSGGDASLTAGNDIALLAGQNYSYSLTEYQHKGSFGRQTHQRDEVTDLSHVGSSVASGGNLTLQSGGDQRYQAANLQSDGDLTLDSGGAIAFEGVKDMHQENHASSSNDWSWMKSSGEGWTDETLRQSQLVAQGNLVIKAVEGISLDIKEIDEHSVSQTIDAMVAADPQLAWLKEMEQRGDIDWQRVKEVHDAYKYDQQGMGPATALAVAIAVSAVTSGAASALVGSMSSAAAGSGALMAAAGTTAAGTAVGAGLGNIVATAALTSMASTAAMSAINNGGDIDVVFKDVTSSDNLKNYVVSAGTAGVTSGLSLQADLNSFSGVGKHAVNEVMGGATSVALSKALGQDASFHGLLESSLINTLAAAGFNQVGNAGKKFELDPGDAEMVAMHALMGGLVAKAQGGEFATGAFAAGVNEAVVADMDKLFHGLDEQTQKDLLLGASQLVGLLAAAVQDPDGDGSHLSIGANVAKASTQYNYLKHKEVEELKSCLNGESCSTQEQKDEMVNNAKALSEFRDEQLNSVCANDPGSAGCRNSMNSAIEYAAMPDAWDFIKDDVHRSSDNVFDNLYNSDGAADRFTFYLDDIDPRANFFGASHLYQQNVGSGVQWFGGAEYVSRAPITGLGADGSASQFTFALGSALGGVWPIYNWRAAAGNALMNGGFDTFRNLYNSGTNDPVAWDVAQLRNEQKLLQPIHEEYLSGFWLGLFRGASNIATNSDYLGLTSLAGLEQKQTMPGGVEILDYESRINYGCKLLGLRGQSACSP